MEIEVETTLAKNLETAEGKAAYDAACKRLLANKEILAWIMKSCLNEYQGMDVKEIMTHIEGEPQIGTVAVHPDETAPDKEQIIGANVEDGTIQEGTVTYDIRFYATAPGREDLIEIIVNLEIQNEYHVGYPLIMRALYYCCRMISSQYGKEFTSPNYGKIKKAYSVWVVANPPKNRQNTITRYVVKEENLIGNVTEEREHYDLLTAIMIGLGPTEEEQEGILKLLDVLLSSEKQADEKKKILSGEFGIAMTKRMEGEILEMCNLSKGIEDKGFQRGVIQGIEQGIEQGMLLAIQSLMKNRKLTAEEAMEALAIEESKRVEYAKKLSQH